MSRCSTVRKHARSSAKPKPRSAARSSITARQPVSRHRRSKASAGPDPPGGQGRHAALVDQRQDHRALRHPGGRTGQAVEIAVGLDLLLAAQVLDDPLLGAAALAHALDQVDVAVGADLLLAHEHPPSLTKDRRMSIQKRLLAKLFSSTPDLRPEPHLSKITHLTAKIAPIPPCTVEDRFKSLCPYNAAFVRRFQMFYGFVGKNN